MESNHVHEQANNLLGQKIKEPNRNKYDNALTRTLRSCCVIPQRYILGVFGLLGVCNAYTMRVCLNLAITQMVNHTKAAGNHSVDPDACPSDEQITGVVTAVVNRPSTLKQWRGAFWVCLGVLVVTNIVYILFAKGEQLWWDDVKVHGYPKDWAHGPLATREDAENHETEKEKGKKF